MKTKNIEKIEPRNANEVFVIASDKNTEISIMNNNGVIIDCCSIKGEFISSAVRKNGSLGIITAVNRERVLSVVSCS